MSKSVGDTKTPLTPVEKALRETLLPADFRDVVFHAYSRRTNLCNDTVRIDHPLPIVAIGSVLKGTEHFSKLLTSGFAEAKRESNSHHVIRQCAHEREYDYDSDSDLDEFEEADDTSLSVAGPSSVCSAGKGKLKAAAVDELEPERALTKNANGGEAHHHILIPNIAYKTLRACIFYLYTGKINFLPLTSKGAAQRRFAMLTTTDTLGPPCSPRSIYRLAKSYGITELQNLAYDEIISQLSPDNIVKEVFSSFCARYDRLREHAVSYLLQNYYNPAVQHALPYVIDAIVQGEALHAGGALRSLLGLRVAMDATPPNPTPTLPQTPSLSTSRPPPASISFVPLSREPTPPATPPAIQLLISPHAIPLLCDPPEVSIGTEERLETTREPKGKKKKKPK